MRIILLNIFGKDLFSLFLSNNHILENLFFFKKKEYFIQNIVSSPRWSYFQEFNYYYYYFRLVGVSVGKNKKKLNFGFQLWTPLQYEVDMFG